jgi:hypothetical protein
MKFIKAAGASLVLLLVFAPCVAAQAPPRVVEARRQDDCGRPDGTPDASRWPRVRLEE